VGRGVVGCLEADFLEPMPGWHDFRRTHVLAKLEAFLKRAVPAYWKRHAHLLAGGAAPPTGQPAQPPRWVPHRPVPSAPPSSGPWPGVRSVAFAAPQHQQQQFAQLRGTVLRTHAGMQQAPTNPQAAQLAGMLATVGPAAPAASEGLPNVAGGSAPHPGLPAAQQGITPDLLRQLMSVAVAAGHQAAQAQHAAALQQEQQRRQQQLGPLAALLSLLSEAPPAQLQQLQQLSQHVQPQPVTNAHAFNSMRQEQQQQQPDPLSSLAQLLLSAAAPNMPGACAPVGNGDKQHAEGQPQSANVQLLGGSAPPAAQPGLPHLLALLLGEGAQDGSAAKRPRLT
jgi:hypothetical protein